MDLEELLKNLIQIVDEMQAEEHKSTPKKHVSDINECINQDRTLALGINLDAGEKLLAVNLSYLYMDKDGPHYKRTIDCYE